MNEKCKENQTESESYDMIKNNYYDRDDCLSPTLIDEVRSKSQVIESSPESPSINLNRKRFIEQPMTLVPQTQNIISLDSNDHVTIVYDTYVEEAVEVLDSSSNIIQEKQVSQPITRSNTHENNPYDVSSSEDDDDNYIRYSAKKNKHRHHYTHNHSQSQNQNFSQNKLQKGVRYDIHEQPSHPNHSSITGTLVSGTILRDVTLLETDLPIQDDVIEENETNLKDDSYGHHHFDSDGVTAP